MDETEAETVERVLRYQARERAAFAESAAARRREALAAVGASSRPTVDVGKAKAPRGDSSLSALCCLACGFFWVADLGRSARPNFCPGCGLEVGRIQ